ncbi:glycosyltransferase [Acidianus ambivalens]|uniref:Glycosyltransferase n=1 Tax=Acidianus ambivalens TaxID=2283 RepID=A0A650CSY8_ACIAM|nr:glycosyltransferase [Acidianus ambivalens]MQL55039.1 glycosyltransferase [Acidianus ambivalens]QGR20597.1 glycosyltransferase [Acidianus ambivalens]
MVLYVIVILSSLVSAWSVYNSFLAIVGIRWNPKEYKNPSGVSFSLIIPAKNEEKVLGRLLDRLENQEYDRSKYEIIVVEDGSTDKTLEVCNSYKLMYDNISCIHLESARVINGKSRALNYALRIAKGEIIGIFDADTVPRLDTLAYASAKFEDPKVAGVQGRLVPINVRESAIARFASLEELFYEYSISGRARLGFFVPLEGTCSFIRKSVLESLGGWNENSLTEDLDLSLKIISSGYKIIYSPSIVAWREVPVSLRMLIKQRLRWYRGHFEVSLKVEKVKFDWRVIDAILIVATPVFMVLNLVNYSLVLLYPSEIYIVVVSLVSFASLLSLLLGIMISRKHMIEEFYPILSFIYMNLVVILNLIAISLELLRMPKKWIKTERTGNITVRIHDS